MRLARVPGWNLLLVAGLVGGQAGLAHGQGNPDARRAQTTRAELEALLQQGGAGLAPAERVLLQERLHEGDFKIGDRVALTVLQDPTLTDTFTVKSGRVLTLPNIPDISLAGVLRSEVQDHLKTELAKYLRNPTVEAVSLVRVAILGSVSRPGYYAVPAETLLGDVIMVAGGPSHSSDPGKITVRRQNRTFLNRQEVQAAIAYGTTIDRLNIQGGDEVFIEEKAQPFVTSARGIILLITAPLAIIFAINRVF